MHINLDDQLKTRFGWDSFRPGQKEILESLLSGKSCLGLLPTGAGKSLTYQLYSSLKGGITLCVTPLIALMEDQVSKARNLGLQAQFIHSQISSQDKVKRLENFEKGLYQLFFVTPERLQKPEFKKVLKNLKIDLFVVDEAHCISLWGHDFRPDYAKLGEIRQEIGNPLTLALTATATQEVQKEILSKLKLEDENLIFAGLKRKNLKVSLTEVYGFENKIEALLPKLRNRTGAILIYVTLIRTAEEVFRELKKKSFDILIYHGDLEPRRRKSEMKRFMQDPMSIMVATPAFGLGIDKSNIRAVYHFEPPASLESFYQEMGRAGRDGQMSESILFYDEEDLTIPMQFIQSAHPENAFIRKVYQLIKENPSRAQTEGESFLHEKLAPKNQKDYRIRSALGILERWGCLEQNDEKINLLKELNEELFELESQEALMKHHNIKLYALVQWIRNLSTCRLVQIYEYFGLKNQSPCGLCDNCQDLNKEKS
ncbi:MAG: RecQ family ATP-dependent DNA helicase [Bdellovibrionales bacterium]